MSRQRTPLLPSWLLRLASPPDATHTKDDSATVVRSGAEGAENGQLPPGAAPTTQGSFTILRRGTRKGRGGGEAAAGGGAGATPAPGGSAQPAPAPPPPMMSRVPPPHAPPLARAGAVPEEEEAAADGGGRETASSGAVELLRPEELPSVDSPEACDKAAIQLRCLLRQVRRGQVSADVLQENLQYAARVLEAVFADEAKVSPQATHRLSADTEGRLADEEDELSEVQPDAVPPEVRAWLATTFTRQLGGGGAGRGRRRWGSDEDSKPRFRSVAHAIRAGIFVDRMYRRVLAAGGPLSMQFPPGVVRVLKTLDDWSFDVFALGESANNTPVKFLGYDLLNRYGMIHKFKVPPSTLEAFLTRIEEGYCRYGNPYHNNIHAADVAQTVHHMLSQTGLMNWLTDLEIFATLVAAIVHDFEHTGTTNNFHVMSGSDTALLYNDRAVLENHHISAAFRTLREEECNILQNLTREDFREFRGLVIDMVLATDMSFHFQQIKNMRNCLTLGESSVDKSKALSLVLHCCDISHPAKRWDLHHRWTALLLEEFFLQGDKERELGLPFSPLCDRNNTLVAESQIGFIEFIVEPSMAVCSDMLESILAPLNSESTKEVPEEGSEEKMEIVKNDEKGEKTSEKAEATSEPTNNSSSKEPASVDASESSRASSGSKFVLKKPWIGCLAENKKSWKEQAVKDAEIRQKQQEEAAARELLENAESQNEANQSSMDDAGGESTKNGASSRNMEE
ncbi:calcium/calmodulin-dependent 3',5'-cyclic nucleotide phosphodiesterase 1A-like isoform X2 [Ischnura elegans]|uniref:calcium/calmodulin-dependent 3',5'-cyclic nucleotide phosphodiesterase 1A-like isoform X2 n=1 Tax=Ischnura elegans TaxID=197161 RepID=UPI001ED87638|nr:calcium/calmodulin-dependent 3',5'-cyclic nucleotide phosphodiesterase 1A-like isoform X2 [Ischnura elegans]